MKVQDIIFFAILAVAVGLRNPRFSVALGIACLLLSIPLFAKWVFFTAERLTWYAVAFFFLAIIQILWEVKHAHRN